MNFRMWQSRPYRTRQHLSLRSTEEQEQFVQEAGMLASLLHRAVLGAGLRLTDQSRESWPEKEGIVQQIVYFYLTSPYDSFRQACAPVLHAWKGTPVAQRATQTVLSLLESLEARRFTIAPAPLAATLSPLQERFAAYYQHLTQQSQSSLRLLRI